jgi:hypothetical protein
MYCIAIKKNMDIICFISTTVLQGTGTQGTIARDYLPDYYCRDISARELMPGNLCQGTNARELMSGN